MSDNQQKIPVSLPSPASENLRRLADLFPSIIKDGEVDFTALKEELGIFEETGKEQYELTWAGKQQAKRIAAEPVVGRTLKYIPEESKNADTTENLYIEGDNLEVLKLLQNGYMGKIKMIYIDPPYNTGKDFVYRDNFAVSARESDQAEGRIGDDGERFVVNSNSSARYHANWLSMMYPRLRLAKNLLSEDGVIFISIDDNEVTNLRKICDEVFGEENFVIQISWRRTDNQPNIGKVARVKEYILCYAKNITTVQLGRLPLTDKAKGEYRYEDENGLFRRAILLDKTRGRYSYPVTTKSGKILNGPWMKTEEDFKKLNEQGAIYWTSGGDEQPYGKIYLKDSQGAIPNDFWGIEYGTNQRASIEVEKIFNKRYFDFPKPISLIETLARLGSTKDSIILDFFSGSATTAHAVMQLNAEDGGNRRFIMVQLPELTDEKSEAYKAGYKNICEIGMERIRRAGEKIKADHPEADIDTGFKVLRTADTNIRWIAAETGQTTLEDVLLGSGKDLRDFMPGTKDLDVVYEILLRQYDIPLTANIEQRSEIGPRTYSIADTIIVCLEETVTEDIISKLAAAEPVPHKIILRDSAFADDISLKENAMMRLDALMQKHSPGGRLPYTVEFL